MKRSRIAAAVVVLFALVSAPALALPVTYHVQKPVELYGHVSQLDDAIQDAFGTEGCGPTATINSFVYLRNKYPNRVSDLIKDEDNDGDVDGDDYVLSVVKLGTDYMKMGTVGGVSDGNFVAGKKKWIMDQTPGKLYISGQSHIGAGGLQKTFPKWPFIYEELRRCEDVEIGLGWETGGGHWLTLTSFKYTDADGDGRIDAFESYVDYNDNDQYDPGEPFTDVDSDGRHDIQEGMLDFIDPWGGVHLEGELYTSTLDGNLWLWYENAFGDEQNGRIEIVVAESPIPEPGTLGLLCIGICTMAARAARKKPRPSS